jgi:ribosome biogenesis protein MAK21
MIGSTVERCMLWLKSHLRWCRYLQFAKDLQEASRDNLAFIKEKSIKAIYDLLCSKPEQEAFLLTSLVDKLGDPSRKIASNVRPCSCSDKSQACKPPSPIAENY